MKRNIDATFTPLARGYLRCNWNGKRIKKAAARRTRNQRLAQLRHDKAEKARLPEPAKPVYPEVTAFNRWGDVECPYCEEVNRDMARSETRTFLCRMCRKPFIAKPCTDNYSVGALA